MKKQEFQKKMIEKSLSCCRNRQRGEEPDIYAHLFFVKVTLQLLVFWKLDVTITKGRLFGNYIEKTANYTPGEVIGLVLRESVGIRRQRLPSGTVNGLAPPEIWPHTINEKSRPVFRSAMIFAMVELV